MAVIIRLAERGGPIEQLVEKLHCGPDECRVR
jgi:hypothetical protein